MTNQNTCPSQQVRREGLSPPRNAPRATQIAATSEAGVMVSDANEGGSQTGGSQHQTPLTKHLAVAGEAADCRGGLTISSPLVDAFGGSGFYHTENAAHWMEGLAAFDQWGSEEINTRTRAETRSDTMDHIRRHEGDYSEGPFKYPIKRAKRRWISFGHLFLAALCVSVFLFAALMATLT